MGNVFLRILVWAVWILAILGNLGVFATLRMLWTSSSDMRSHFLLMANVALADLAIGAYLAMLAVEDARTAGSYYNYAVDWQTGSGCAGAGFLSVFGSVLSIYCMMLMSSELLYKYWFAIQMKRLSLKQTMGLVALGWALAVVFATLPLVGVSSYSATATCLPMRVRSEADQIYLVFALCLNFIFFLTICICYAILFGSTVRSQASDAREHTLAVAKSFAPIIITDFATWVPTIFFGLSAAAGAPLISISAAKYLLVIFYPINSCANPYLYVFSTKHFRKACNRMIRRNTILRSIRGHITGESAFSTGKSTARFSKFTSSESKSFSTKKSFLSSHNSTDYKATGTGHGIMKSASRESNSRGPGEPRVRLSLAPQPRYISASHTPSPSPSTLALAEGYREISQQNNGVLAPTRGSNQSTGALDDHPDQTSLGDRRQSEGQLKLNRPSPEFLADWKEHWIESVAETTETSLSVPDTTFDNVSIYADAPQAPSETVPLAHAEDTGEDTFQDANEAADQLLV